MGVDAANPHDRGGGGDVLPCPEIAPWRSRRGPRDGHSFQGEL